MESARIGASTRVRVSISTPIPQQSQRNHFASEWAPKILMRSARKPSALRRVRDEKKETMDPILTQDYKNDELINAVEVREWENGKSIDDIAAKQGIRIRRHPAKGLDSPRNILEKIIWDKVIEVAEMKKMKPLTLVKEAVEEAPPPRDFLGALKASYQRTGVPALIAEVKKASPSKGVLRKDFNPGASAYICLQTPLSLAAALNDLHTEEFSFFHAASASSYRECSCHLSGTL